MVDLRLLQGLSWAADYRWSLDGYSDHCGVQFLVVGPFMALRNLSAEACEQSMETFNSMSSRQSLRSEFSYIKFKSIYNKALQTT